MRAGRFSAAFLANQSLAAAAQARAPAAAPSPARGAGDASADASFLQVGGPPPGEAAATAAVAGASHLSSQVSAALSEPLSSQAAAALHPGVLNLTAVHDNLLPGDVAGDVTADVAAAHDRKAAAALNLTGSLTQDALSQLALVFEPRQPAAEVAAGGAAAVAALVRTAAPASAPAAAPAVALVLAPALAPALASAPVLVPAPARQQVLESSAFSASNPAALLGALAAQSPPASPTKSAVNLQADANSAQLQEQSRQAADIDARIAANWQALMANWDLLDRVSQSAGSSPPKRRRRSLLDSLVQPAAAPSQQRPGRLAALLAKAGGALRSMFRRGGSAAAAAVPAHRHSGRAPSDRPGRRRALLVAFPSAAAAPAAAAPAAAELAGVAALVPTAVSRALRANQALLRSFDLDASQLQWLQRIAPERPSQDGASTSQLVTAFSVDSPRAPIFTEQQVTRSPIEDPLLEAGTGTDDRTALPMQRWCHIPHVMSATVARLVPPAARFDRGASC